MALSQNDLLLLGLGGSLGGGLLSAFGPRQSASVQFDPLAGAGGGRNFLLSLLTGDQGALNRDVAIGQALHERLGGPARDLLLENLRGFAATDPLALSPETQASLDAQLSNILSIIQSNKEMDREDLVRRLSGRFGQGFESTGAFLAEEEKFVSRPFANATAMALSDNALRRIQAGQASTQLRQSGLNSLANIALRVPEIVSNTGVQAILSALQGNRPDVGFDRPSDATAFGSGALSGLSTLSFLGAAGAFNRGGGTNALSRALGGATTAATGANALSGAFGAGGFSAAPALPAGFSLTGATGIGGGAALGAGALTAAELAAAEGLLTTGTGIGGIGTTGGAAGLGVGGAAAIAAPFAVALGLPQLRNLIDAPVDTTPQQFATNQLAGVAEQKFEGTLDALRGIGLGVSDPRQLGQGSFAQFGTNVNAQLQELFDAQGRFTGSADQVNDIFVRALLPLFPGGFVPMSLLEFDFLNNDPSQLQDMLTAEAQSGGVIMAQVNPVTGAVIRVLGPQAVAVNQFA